MFQTLSAQNKESLPKIVAHPVYTLLILCLYPTYAMSEQGTQALLMAKATVAKTECGEP